MHSIAVGDAYGSRIAFFIATLKGSDWFDPYGVGLIHLAGLPGTRVPGYSVSRFQREERLKAGTAQVSNSRYIHARLNSILPHSGQVWASCSTPPKNGSTFGSSKPAE